MNFTSDQAIRFCQTGDSRLGGSGAIEANTDLLARTTKTMAHCDQVLADLFEMVSGLSDRLIGDALHSNVSAEPPHPPAPGAVNELLWRAEAQAAHLTQLREKLARLLAVL